MEYARKEQEKTLALKLKEDELYAAATADIFEPWTAERVANRLAKGHEQQIHLLMERDKQRPNTRQRMEIQF